MRSRAVFALALILAAGGACRPSSEVTGVRIVVRFGTPTDQIEFTVTRASDSAALLEATPRPLKPGASLRSPADIVVYLPDDQNDQDVICAARLMNAGEVAGSGSSTVRVKAHQVVPVELAINEADDGGVDQRQPWDGAARAIGDLCNENDECDSDYCVNGVCCDSACNGICQQCNVPGKYGTCTFSAPATRDNRCPDDGASSCGRDGTCDGNGGCRLYGAGTSCMPNACTYATGDFKLQSSCDGNGTCTTGAMVSCAPYRCNTGGCLDSCTVDGDCVGGTCSGGICSGVVKKPLGQPCTGGTQCASGICADGVCCSSDCSKQACRKCDSTGTCAPVAAGTADPHVLCMASDATTCGLDGKCDGTGACRNWVAGTLCSNMGGYCGNVTRSILWAHRCDGAGMCAGTFTSRDCAPYTCMPYYNSAFCTTGCTTVNECATGGRCESGKCVGAADAGTGG